VSVELGHRFEDLTTGTACIEYHIDTWDKYSTSEAVKRQFPTQPEPTMSIRVSSSQPQAKPIMITHLGQVGQDESVIAQFLIGTKTWIGPKGQRPLLPKSEGEGYMLSAFVSRELGFGRTLTADELMRINNERRAGKTYTDVQAANEIYKTDQKPLLTESPFVKYLYIGANNDGYWNGFHMSLQFEDVVDCLMVLYPEFEFVFLFDHSQGHARKRNGALNAQHMSKYYGGVQPVMRETKILSDNGFLGPFSPSLRVGDVQSLIFNPEDQGAWYLSPAERERQRRDRATGKRKAVKRTKKMLVEALVGAGVRLQPQRNHSKKELQEFARTNGVALFEDKEIVNPGWEGQPKGLLQVLWERGHIERQCIQVVRLVHN